MSISRASQQRVRNFIGEFIRSEFVQNWQSEKDSDFINEPERAARCYDAAEFGADGKTHAEVIEDWREAFEAYIKWERRGHEYPYKFAEAVCAEFDATELNLERMGILWEHVG